MSACTRSKAVVACDSLVGNGSLVNFASGHARHTVEYALFRVGRLEICFILAIGVWPSL